MKFNLYLACFILNFVLIFGFIEINEDFDFNVSEIHRLIKSRKWNCTDVVSYFLERSIRYNPAIHAIISYNPKALEEAISLDDYFYKNNRLIGKLHCIPALVKDNIDVKGLPTTGGINALRYSIPNIDANVVEKLKMAGAIIISKANLAELARGIYNSETGGGCRNPWDFTRTCGASSSGSGAGIAASMGIISLGTDTEGSIVVPATVNGLFALRPAVGEVSASGIIPFFSRQDVPGPFAKYLDDVVLSYYIMKGNADLFNEYQTVTTKKFKVGYLDRFFRTFYVSNVFGNLTYIIDDQVNVLLNKAVENIKKLNVDTVEISVKDDEFAQYLELTVQMIFRRGAAVDACLKLEVNKYFSDKARFNTDAPYTSFDSFLQSPLLSKHWRQVFNNVNGFTEENCQRSLEAYDNTRLKFIQLFDLWYDRGSVDILIFPTLTDLPFKLDANVSNISPISLSPYLNYPSLNVPIGFSKATDDAPEGLPVSMLMIAKNSALMDTFKVAKLFETAYIKSHKLPRSTPIISGRCISSSTNKTAFEFVYLFILLVFHLKKFIA